MAAESASAAALPLGNARNAMTRRSALQKHAASRGERCPLAGRNEKKEQQEVTIDLSQQMIRQPSDGYGTDSADQFWADAYYIERKHGAKLVVHHLRNLRADAEHGWTSDDYWYVDYRTGESLGRLPQIDDPESDEDYLVVGRVLSE